MFKFHLYFLFFFCCVCMQAQTHSLNLPAKVIRILDGDTVEVLYVQLPLKVRLAHIDAPEKRGHQAFGKAAKKALSALCFGQTVHLISEGKFDRSGRLLAEIINEKGENANQILVQKGMAWHFKKYSSDSVYARLEKEARKKKIGLWQQKKPTPPWKWRKRKK